MCLTYCRIAARFPTLIVTIGEVWAFCINCIRSQCLTVCFFDMALQMTVNNVNCISEVICLLYFLVIIGLIIIDMSYGAFSCGASC